MASIYMRAGQPSLAKKWLDKAINRSPEDIVNYNARGFSAFTTAFRPAVRPKQKWKLQSYTYDGVIDIDTDRFKEMEFWYKRSLELQKTGTAYAQLAWAYSRTGQFDLAEELLWQSVRDNLADKKHIKELIYIYVKTGQLDKLTELRETITSIPSSSSRQEEATVTDDSNESREGTELQDSTKTQELKDAKGGDKSLKELADDQQNQDTIDATMKADSLQPVQSRSILLESLDYHEVYGIANLLLSNEDRFNESVASMGAVIELEPELLYEIARIYAMNQQVDESLNYLSQAIDAGFDEVQDVKNNSDLDNLRQDERFAALVDKIEK